MACSGKLNKQITHLTSHPPKAKLGSEPDDLSLVQETAKGNPDAFKRLYQRYARELEVYLDKILGKAEAEEQVQEIFLRLWLIASRFEPARASLKGWLFMIARRMAIDIVRKRKSHPHLLLQQDIAGYLEYEQNQKTPDRLAAQKERSRVLNQAMERLPSGESQALQWVYFKGWSVYELSLRRKVPLGTLKSRVRTGMIHLRELLKNYHWTEG
jgi:RNA polymerase sigma-70 factor (ECF subfamily)